MDNEMKAKRLEDMARWDEKQALRWKDIANNCKSHPNESAGSMALSESASSEAALLREAAQLMREREGKSLLTGPDWKTMYEAQERDMAALRKEREELREKAELLEWALDHVVDYGSRTLEFVGGKYVIETPLRLKDPADFAELDCDQWNAQYLLSALRAARGEK
jgi:hypothetical protein